MSRRLAFVLAGWIAMAAAPRAQDANTPPDTQAPLSALVYSDRRIPDADRARLVELMTQLVPLDQWRLTTVQKGTTLDRLVDCFYDAYESDRDSTLTAAALKLAIQRRHLLLDWPLKNDETIELLPFPAIAERKRDRRLPDSFRVYDSQQDAYSVTRRLDTWSSSSLARVANVTVTPERDPPPAPSACGARLAHRNSTYTAVIVRTDGGRDGLLREGLPDSISRVSFGPNMPIARSRVQLLEQDGLQDCLDHVDYLRTSPFWKSLKKTVARAAPQLATVAKSFPLVIVDQNFAGDSNDGEGHGFKVRKVIEQVLTDLRVPELIPIALRNEELCPTKLDEIEALRTLVGEVSAARPDLPPAFTTEATGWLSKRGQACVGNDFEVPDLVLAAVLRKSLKEGHWMTLSFRAKGAASTVLPGVFEHSTSVSLVAAGNEMKTLEGSWAPQIEASKTSRVILVTFGDGKGVYGTFSDHRNEGLKVDVTAPGCGIGETWTPASSSLATPLVAVSVWLKEALRRASGGTPVENEALRSDITAASRPLASIGDRVLSAGLFDVARYVMAPLRYIQFTSIERAHGRGQEIVPLLGGELKVRCDAAAGPIPQFPGGPTQSRLHTLVPIRGEHSWVLARRELGIKHRFQQFVPACTPLGTDGFSLKLYYADGTEETLDWATFTRDVVEVSF